ncbi:hypothetical protein KC356_g2359 [Hortaea werneckii]|nr:hypothetical protein KC356_g2359 [Hortaea werneckii]
MKPLHLSFAALTIPAVLANSSKYYSYHHPHPTTMPTDPLNPSLQNILAHAYDAPLYSYPTSLTQGIIPKHLHSHNDYWRPLPFWSALSAGAISTEADVWLYNDTLHVGHEESALTPERTFDALYIQPILSVLRKQNPESKFVHNDAPTRNGVFDTNSGQTLYLFVDVKTDGSKTWPYVLRALEPLREAGYLTTYSDGTMTSGPVTVIGTGNTPLPAVQSASPRDAFYDAKLPLLSTTQSNLTSDVSPIASTSFKRQFGEVRGQTLNTTQVDLLEAQIAAANERGMMARYWDQPEWPVATRNAIWRTLWDAGVGLLNVDDLDAAAGFWEGEG